MDVFYLLEDPLEKAAKSVSCDVMKIFLNVQKRVV